MVRPLALHKGWNTWKGLDQQSSHPLNLNLESLMCQTTYVLINLFFS